MCVCVTTYDHHDRKLRASAQLAIPQLYLISIFLVPRSFGFIVKVITITVS